MRPTFYPQQQQQQHRPGPMMMAPGPPMPMNMPMRPGMMPMQMNVNMGMMRPPMNVNQTGGPPVKPLLPFVNTYAARLKDGQQVQPDGTTTTTATSSSSSSGIGIGSGSSASTLLMPLSTGVVVVGKRKRATRVEQMNLDDEIGSIDSEDEIDKDDPKDVDAEAVDDRLRIMQRQHNAPPPNSSAALALAAAAKEKEKEKERAKQQRRLKKTRHEYMLPYYRDEAATRVETLVPIRLDFEVDGMKLKDAFMWNLKDKFLTPKRFAEFLCEDLDLPTAQFVPIVEDAIKTQIAEHLTLLSSEVPFEEDTRIVINLDILFNQYHLIDRFEWDLSSSLTPEAFALQLAQDLGLGSEFSPLVAHAIHEQIAKVKTVVASASNNTPSANASATEDVDEANLILGMLRESTRPLEIGLRQGREHDIEEWGPIVEEMSREGVEKYITDRERDKAKRQRNNRVGALNRKRNAFLIGFSAAFLNAGTLGDDEVSFSPLVFYGA
ncbi:UNVERIFIED_CONTAM: hypothetical protein HDU68_006861 [Siphonaria sp. JEL0065]|nr:hypothetical protein HDU68_006861 [Siphonaria sp. JEL0065]